MGDCDDLSPLRDFVRAMATLVGQTSEREVSDGLKANGTWLTARPLRRAEKRSTFRRGRNVPRARDYPVRSPRDARRWRKAPSAFPPCAAEQPV